MNISNNGLELIKQFEGCRLTAYQDSTGLWTIGYGHTKDVSAGQKITQKQADKFLREDIVGSERRVDRAVIGIKLRQYEYDCLVSQAFNLKSFEMLASYLPDREKYKNKMLLYYKTIGSEKGLKIRRICERLMFENRAWKRVMLHLQTLNLHQIIEEEKNLFKSPAIEPEEIPEAKPAEVKKIKFWERVRKFFNLTQVKT